MHDSCIFSFTSSGTCSPYIFYDHICWECQGRRFSLCFSIILSTDFADPGAIYEANASLWKISISSTTLPFATGLIRSPKSLESCSIFTQLTFFATPQAVDFTRHLDGPQKYVNICCTLLRHHNVSQIGSNEESLKLFCPY